MDKIGLIEAEEIERRAWRKLWAASARMDSAYCQIGSGTVNREELAEEISAIAKTLTECHEAWNLACLTVQRLQAEERRRNTQRRMVAA